VGKQELDAITLKHLENEFRLYPLLPKLKAEAELEAQYRQKEEDVNAGIKSNYPVSNPTAAQVLAKYNSPKVKRLNELENQIKTAYSNLAPELQLIVTECLWGDYSYINWEHGVPERYHCSKNTAYRMRYKILEQLAIAKGFL
jgi:RinA family phage transcriptional activator